MDFRRSKLYMSIWLLTKETISVDLVLKGHNIIIIGQAGTGKSHLLVEMIFIYMKVIGNENCSSLCIDWNSHLPVPPENLTPKLCINGQLCWMGDILKKNN